MATACGELSSTLRNLDAELQCFLHTVRNLCSMTMNDEILHTMAESSKRPFINDDAFTSEGVGIVFGMMRIM